MCGWQPAKYARNELFKGGAIFRSRFTGAVFSYQMSEHVMVAFRSPTTIARRKNSQEDLGGAEASFRSWKLLVHRGTVCLRMDLSKLMNSFTKFKVGGKEYLVLNNLHWRVAFLCLRWGLGDKTDRSKIASVYWRTDYSMVSLDIFLVGTRTIYMCILFMDGSSFWVILFSSYAVQRSSISFYNTVGCRS